MDYKACWEYQQRLFDTLLRAKGTPAEGAGYLLLVEHPAVYTLGTSARSGRKIPTSQLSSLFPIWMRNPTCWTR